MKADSVPRAAGHRAQGDVVVILTLAVAAALFAFGGWAWRLDRLVYDEALSLWSRPTPADIVIVAIDDASLTAIGRWPWPRAVHATLLERLAQAHPRAIALDLLLSEPDPDPRQDALLAQALAHAAPVVLPVAWRADVSAPAPIEPIDMLRPLVRLGVAEPSTDADGVLRHAFLHAGPPGRLWPNVALALLQAGGDTPNPALKPVSDAATGRTADASPTWQRSGRFPIRFVGPPGAITQVSYVDVLSGAVPAARLAGRYVLVGATAQGLGDRQATPVDGRGPAMAGIEVLANVLHSLLGDDCIVELDATAVAGVSILGLGLLVVGLTRVGPRRALPVAIAAAPLAVATSVVLMRFGVWCNPMPFSLAALLAYPLWSWRRLERAMAGLDREIDTLREAITPRPLRAATAPDDAIGGRLHALREAADVVREARRFLAEAIAALPTAMLVAGDDQRVSLANAKAAALFDVADADEMIGLDLVRLLQEFSTPEPTDWHAALTGLVAGGAGIATEARLGEPLAVMLHVAAVDLPGSRRWVVTLADVGPIRQAEREREEALAFVSHDLRAPAGSIVMLADMNLQGALATPHDELLVQMRRLAARTVELADAFVRSSRAGTQALQRAPTDLRELIDDALADLRAQADTRRIGLDTDIVDASVTVDRFLLTRAIGNLVSNAIKHSPEGAAVQVQAAVRADRMVVRVRDNGPGLAPRQIAELSAGERGASAGGPQGVGLGLLFVQRVARRHGGHLQLVASTPDEGTIFQIDVASGDSGNP